MAAKVNNKNYQIYENCVINGDLSLSGDKCIVMYCKIYGTSSPIALGGNFNSVNNCSFVNLPGIDFNKTSKFVKIAYGGREIQVSSKKLKKIFEKYFRKEIVCSSFEGEQ